MNKYITMLLLGVVGASMILVVFVHMSQNQDQPASGQGQGSNHEVVYTYGGSSLNEVQTRETPASGGVTLPAGMSLGGQATPAQIVKVDGTDSNASTKPSGREDTTLHPGDKPNTGQSSEQSPQQLANATQQNTAETESQGAASTQNLHPANTPPVAPARPSVALVHGGNIKDISLHFKDKGMILRIEADSPLTAKYFLLTAPERLVLDLPGNWKGLKTPEIPSNYLLKNVRIGRQNNADRIVMDLTSHLKKHELIKVSDHKIEMFFE